MGRRAWESTAVAPLGGGRYRGEIESRWALAMVPQGGVVAALAARAMAEELDVEQPLRSLHVVFARPVPVGEVTVAVEPLRRGRSMSQARAGLGPGDSTDALAALAVFGGDRTGFEFTELTPPDVPGPDESKAYRDPMPPEIEADVVRWPFWEELVESRLARGRMFFELEEPGAAECVNWFRFDDPPLVGEGQLDPLALLVLADVMPGAVFQRVGRTESRWFSPSIDLSVHLFAPATPGWILAHAKAHHAADGYAAGEMALWDPRGPDGPRLVAWASQQMFFTSMD